MLYHISEDPKIARFEPRPSEYTAEPVVWAIEEERLRNYLLPRDCPQVTFSAGHATSPDDVARFLEKSSAVVAVELGWLERIKQTRLYCYHLPDETFELLNRAAGYYISRVAVHPERVAMIDDPLAALDARGLEFRALPSLWPLHDAVSTSTLSFSIIRMRNAQPRHESLLPEA